MAKAPDLDCPSELLLADRRERNRWRRSCLSPWHILTYIFIIILVALTVIVTLFHVQVVRILSPFSAIIRDLPAGFLIPGAIAFAISYPPLFGHEIIAIVCGAVYGLYVGFAIMAAGTIVGEAATWITFRQLFRRRALRLQQTSLSYGSLAQIAREGGFPTQSMLTRRTTQLVLLVRMSVIPQHFSTAFLSTCSVRFWHFSVAALLTVPKQLALVYLGSLPVSSGIIKAGHSAASTSASGPLNANVTFDTSVIIQLAVLGAALLVSAGLAAFIYIKARKIRNVLLEEQHRRRVLIAVAPGLAGGNGDSSNPLYSGPGSASHWRSSRTHAGNDRVSMNSTTSSFYSMDNDNRLSRGNSIRGLLAQAWPVTRKSLVGAATTPGSDHGSLVSGTKLQQDHHYQDQDDCGEYTRGRTRTRTTRGKKNVPVIAVPPPPPPAAQSDKSDKATTKTKSTARSASDKSSKHDFYLLHQREHELSSLSAARSKDKTKTKKKQKQKQKTSSGSSKHHQTKNSNDSSSSSGSSSGLRDYNYVLPPPVPPPALFPPLPPPPPLTSLLQGASSTATSGGQLPRPSSSSSLSVTSFSRPRPPRPPSSSQQSQKQQQQQQHRRVRTLSVGSTGTGGGGSVAGHSYHSRFQSEDSTLPTMDNLPLPMGRSVVGLVGEAISTPSEI
ncbi:hypothetical protein Micbo1qcDRAFT_216888 [Microdochium bolleyi]|uniref:Golgi apparatus membrane protein TVP38 n=1 Tax=Microdochium bolleyi TaxID=196109 RepID=A0A136JDH4_9PEZI|nr:hypothetical protein Micbo1qcDRAFT_216888 [Microdochium bolleyi]